MLLRSFVLLAAVLPIPAFAAGIAGDGACRNGAFPSEQSRFALARVVGTQRLYLLGDMDGCPAKGEPACRQRSYVVNGDVVVTWTVDSTNAELLRCSAPQRGVSVLLAERQTGGRGRRGRTWASPLAAHVYLSVLRLYSGGLGRLAGLSLVAGIAVAEALHDLGFTQAQLKWPNDLIVDGKRKLVGLLAEGGGEYAGPARAVIGIGINTHMPPAFAEQITQPWVDLDTLAGKPVDRNVVVAAVLTRLLPALEEFDREGLAPFLPRYAAFDMLAGREVRVELEGQWQHGTALGLADDGALRVRIDGQERLLHAGEVSVRAA